jgi:hypothetical protein
VQHVSQLFDTNEGKTSADDRLSSIKTLIASSFSSSQMMRRMNTSYLVVRGLLHLFCTLAGPFAPVKPPGRVSCVISISVNALLYRAGWYNSDVFVLYSGSSQFEPRLC